MLKDKLSALLSLTNKKQVDICPVYNMSPQNFNNKFREVRFNLKDLVILAAATDTQLAFVDKNNNVIVKFDMDDLDKKEAE